MKIRAKITLAALVLFHFSSAQVSITFEDPAAAGAAEITGGTCNQNPGNYLLKGWKFRTSTFTDWITDDVSSHTTQGLGPVQYTTRLPDYHQNLGPAVCIVRSYRGTIPDAVSATVFDAQMLIKTGSCSDIPGKIDADPIQCSEIAALTQNPDYYGDQCIVDTLGINGGAKAGGFVSTFYGQTQIQTAIPSHSFIHNLTNSRWDPNSLGGPMYMMSVAMSQEYMNADMQYMIAIAGKETFFGFVQDGLEDQGSVSEWAQYNRDDDNAFGPWEIENSTYVKVMQAYPQFYPDYACLAGYPDVTTAINGCLGGNANLAPAFYSTTPGAGPPSKTGPDSPQIANSVLASTLVFYWLYDAMLRATDLCFADAIMNGVDKRLTLAALLPGYNLGPNSGFESPLYSAALKDDPAASEQFPSGNLAYRQNVFNLLDIMVGASKTSITCGGSNEIFDTDITWNDIMRFYYGETGVSGVAGTPQTQADGGLLLHFDLTVEQRTNLQNDLQCAFDQLKGKAPSTTGKDAVSFRYDWLTIMRVAKGYLGRERGFPVQSDFNIWVDARDNNEQTCAGIFKDDEFPGMTITSPAQGAVVNQNFTVEFDARDNVADPAMVGEWSMDPGWNSWQPATLVSPGKYSFDVSCENIHFPDAGEAGVLWVRSTDGCGNSTIQDFNFTTGPEYSCTNSPDTVAIVAADPPGGIYVDSVSVSLTVSTDGARIFYTLDGTDPSDSETGSTLLYTGTPIHITASTTVKAWAVKTGNWVNSAVITELYILTQTPPDTVALPQISPPGGSFFESVTVTITVTTSDARILYTRDGSDPSTTAGGSTLLYSGPITITDNTTIKATAVKDGNWVPGGVVTEVYVISDLPVLVKPVPIPGTSNFTSSPKFPQTIDVTFAVHPDDADIYYTLDGTDPRTSATAVLYNPGEVLTFDASTTLTAYANKEGDWTPSDTVVAVYTEIMVEDPVVALKAWIEDGNGDGEPDSIYIAFETSIPRIPDVVNDVFWPDATVVPLTVTHDAANPATSPIQLYLDDTVVLDFAQNPFGYGLTLAGEPEPTLNLPDNVLFANQKLVIEDSVGAVIMEATRVTSDQGRYGVIDDDGNITFHKNPDTLVVTLSEALINTGDADAHYSLIGRVKDCDEDNGEEIMAVSFTPEVSDDGLTWTFHIEGDSPGEILGPGDCVFLRRESSYADAHSNLNTPARVEVGGEDAESIHIQSMIFIPIIGSVTTSEDHYGTNLLAGGQLPLYNEQGEIVDYLEDPGGIDWIPPLHMDETGSIDEELNESCGTPVQSQDPRPFPGDCLSAIVVKSEGSYEARVQIHDHLGKFIHSSTQRFGKCGELENDDRIRPGGFLSFLVWNQKDDMEQYVGSGVYLWRVQFKVDGVNSSMQIYRQGIARNDQNSIECEGSF